MSQQLSFISIEVLPDNNVSVHLNTNQIMNHLQSTLSDVLYQQLGVSSNFSLANILSQSFQQDSELKRNNNNKIYMKPVTFRYHTQEMKQQLKKLNVSYRHCLYKNELIELFEKHVSPNECSICKDTIVHNTSIYNVPCCHKLFHTKCLNEWIKYKKNCPLCRKDLH